MSWAAALETRGGIEHKLLLQELIMNLGLKAFHQLRDNEGNEDTAGGVNCLSVTGK